MMNTKDDVLTAPVKSNSDYELTPVGTHIATIYKIVYLGTLPVEWQGEMKKVQKIRIFWEIPNEMKTYKDKDGKEQRVPFAISQKYTLSMGSKSNLRPLVTSMTGVSMTDEEAGNFNIYSLLGHSCMLNITHEKSRDGQREYAMVTSAIALPRGTAMPTSINEVEKLSVLSLTKEQIAELPDYLKKDMESSDEYASRFGNNLNEEDDDDINPEDIPF